MQDNKSIMKITKKFGIDFDSPGGALTLGVSEVSENNRVCDGEHSRTHSDGWTIKGFVREDYYAWVNDFEATHPKLGRVWGNFEHEVHASSKKAFDHFYKNHKPKAWDYMDI